MENDISKNDQQNQSDLLQSMLGINLEGQIRSKLYTIITWSRITAIAGFVNVGLNLLNTFIKYNSHQSFGLHFSWTIVTTVISLAISFFLNFFLFQFSRQLKVSMDINDQEAFAAAALHLKSYMRMLGILLIVTILVSIFTSGFLAIMGARF